MSQTEKKISQTTPDTDPFTAEVIKDSLQALCDEMAVAMVKTAISAVIHEIPRKFGRLNNIIFSEMS